MLFIHCPYCDESRSLEDFTFAGEAFVKRPIQPEEITDEKWANYVFFQQ